MAKPLLVTLPFVLLLLDYWPLGRFADEKNTDPLAQPPLKTVNSFHGERPVTRLVLEKLPLLFISIISSYYIFFSRLGEELIIPLSDRAIWLRISIAPVSYIQYLEKMVWPRNLSSFYPYPDSLPAWQVAGSLFLLVLLSVFFIRSGRYPYLTTGWLWFLGTLVPFIGIVQWGLWPTISDRFAYVPLIGMFMIISWGCADIFKSRRYRKTFLPLLTGIVLGLLMICSFHQVKFWKNSKTLFERAVKVTDNNYTAHYNLATVLHHQGKLKEAIKYYTEALQIRPDGVKALYNLGVVLSQTGKTDEATAHYAEVLRIDPEHAEAHNNLGVALTSAGRHKEAVAHFSKALSLKPKLEAARTNLENALKEINK